jgi:hypothetical protein
MSRNRWTIHSTGGGRQGSLLNGFVIEELDDGSFRLSSPNPNGTQLATAPAGTPPISFTQFLYDPGWWNLAITQVTASGISGGWSNNAPDPTAESGTWASDVGVGDEGEEAEESEVSDESKASEASAN